MSYDSDASFADFSGDFTSDPPAAPAAAPDRAASTAWIAETAVAMAAASSANDFGADGGWDAPPPSPQVRTGAHAFATASGNGWNPAYDADDDDDEPGRAAERRAPRPLSAQARMLVDVALRAYTLHPDFGHQSTAEVAHALGHPELDGLSANAQVTLLRSQWREVDVGRALALAGRGTLVIAGRAGEGDTGHTAIVLPGDPVMARGRPWPLVCGGGAPRRRSDGSRSACDIWSLRERTAVRWFTPETRSWLRRLLDF